MVVLTPPVVEVPYVAFRVQVVGVGKSPDTAVALVDAKTGAAFGSLLVTTTPDLTNTWLLDISFWYTL
jgi:hypothetical protein